MAQIVTTDALLLVVLILAGAGIRPNLHLRYVRKIAWFSGQAFAAGLLINSISRNIDNLLVGKFQDRRRSRSTGSHIDYCSCRFSSSRSRLEASSSRLSRGKLATSQRSDCN